MSDTDFDIGTRLRLLRQDRRLSQRQLAARAGVTNGLISMIEQNKISPSVANLKKILDGLTTSMVDFFMETEEEPRTFWAHDELPEIRSATVHGPEATAAKLSLLRIGRADRNSLMMLHESYDPGADTGETLYSHEAEEAGIVIEGRIEITVGDEVSELGPGDAYIFDSRRPHRFRNTGDTRCVIVSACTPPTF
ncbi:cupin domain-containing protein [Paracoccus sp. R12_1]|uniref:cupin domain-containing protein n=1 Tax=unclassified Paracoccus (in: a-proteobacteria) TaxID=2688777 RepID=UPI001ADC6DCF|nr:MULTISPECIES: cupin domain-containing protein [unclassified Paracoccus (in: a-proteobacteria)]MBO9453585.1 cupin domain-containing protein [Paracoccus sp. R12_2]MBO9486991.1 cupin domain-containing protein [Paracoccus sp. R12_1]